MDSKIFKDFKEFSPFNEGLKKYLFEKFSKNKTDEELAQLLFESFLNLGFEIERKTVFSWISGKQRPKIETKSRKNMYALCFALELSYEKTVNFFQQVYFDRAFNCHNLEEAVFCWAFSHNIGYKKALEIIKEIEAAPLCFKIQNQEEIPNYTQFIRLQILEIEKEEDLKAFLVSQKANFDVWNQSAAKELQNFRQILLGSEENCQLIDNLKRTLKRKIKLNKDLNNFNEKKYENCGLIFREILYDARNQEAYSILEYINDEIGGVNVFSNNFILRKILSSEKGTQKNIELPYIMRNNFPNKKLLSDVLSKEKMDKLKSYDAIRKMLILLEFYSFWVNIKLENSKDFTMEEFAMAYEEESNALLLSCGYEALYENNPYDYIYLWAAKKENPLEEFRYIIGELLPE